MEIDLKIFEERLIRDYQYNLKSNELLEKFRGLTTTEIADSLGENYIMDYGIKPISYGMK